MCIFLIWFFFFENIKDGSRAIRYPEEIQFVGDFGIHNIAEKITV